MEFHAQTDAEWDDVTADTGRIFGPFLLGVPFAIIYTLLWLTGCSMTGLAIGAIQRRRTNPKDHLPQQTYSDYRESLVREYIENANAPSTTPEDAG